MSHNRLVHYGILVIVASVFIWVGAQLTKRIEWIVPYAGGAGVVMVLLGLYWAHRKKQKELSPPGEKIE
jgi:hypothetical protein